MIIEYSPSNPSMSGNAISRKYFNGFDCGKKLTAVTFESKILSIYVRISYKPLVMLSKSSN